MQILVPLPGPAESDPGRWPGPSTYLSDLVFWYRNLVT